ncbi:MAG: hypothetical protein LBP35_00755 [Candidatus Ancillula trichonymphae]|jgi:hypothetical protein|nr:hypothetical protein [Candidatus Ancillula trichonymphae]
MTSELLDSGRLQVNLLTRVKLVDGTVLDIDYTELDEAVVEQINWTSNPRSVAKLGVRTIW